METITYRVPIYSTIKLDETNTNCEVLLDRQLVSKNKIIVKYKNNDYELGININNQEMFEEIFNNLDIVSFESYHLTKHHLIIKFKVDLSHHDIINRLNKMNSFLKYYNSQNPFSKVTYQNILSEFTIHQMAPKLPFELFPYQKNTIYLMNQLITKKQECIISNKINDSLYYNKFTNFLTPEPDKISFEIKGGIIADEMGLGKTITSIAFTETQSSITPGFDEKNLITPFISRAHLILVPSHLGKQWISEINKCFPEKTCLAIFTKNHHESVTTEDVLNADFVLVSYQFLSNCAYYPSYLYYNTTPSRFNLLDKINFIKGIDKNKLYQDHPLFETIKWNQLIVDEGHEIMENNFGSSSLSNILTSYLNNFQAENYWYVSGTPFNSDIGLINILKFLKLKINVSYQSLDKKTYHYQYNFNDGIKNPYHLIYYHPDFLEKIIFRHSKEQVEKQINLKGLKEEIYWLNQTEMEKQLYQASKNKSRDYLLQLCCHLLVADLTSTMKFQTVNLEDVKKNLLDTHQHNVTTYTHKLTLLDPKNQSYHMLKKKYQDIVSQSSYILQTLKNLDKEDETKVEDNECSICMDTITDPALLSCGHIFCYDCIEHFTNSCKKCPLCKLDLTDKIVRVKSVHSQTEKKDELEEKYGVKTGFLIKLVRKILADSNNKIIIFSQYDFMLNLVSESLSSNGVANSFVKGNVHQRVKAIEKFKGLRLNEDENKVIMLSLKNSASGTHLVEANHIIFIEPIDKTKDVVQDIENQAVARAFRIGQKNEVKIHRLFVKNTLEEEIYQKVYKKEDLN